MPPKTRNFRNITADFFQFDEVGKSLEGMLVEKDSVPFSRAGQTSEVGRYTVQTDDGQRIAFLGGTVIDQTLGPVDEGAYIKVTYIGTKPTGNKQNVKQFTIELAD